MFSLRKYFYRNCRPINTNIYVYFWEYFSRKWSQLIKNGRPCAIRYFSEEIFLYEVKGVDYKRNFFCLSSREYFYRTWRPLTINETLIRVRDIPWKPLNGKWIFLNTNGISCDKIGLFFPPWNPLSGILAYQNWPCVIHFFLQNIFTMALKNNHSQSNSKKR